MEHLSSMQVQREHGADTLHPVTVLSSPARGCLSTLLRLPGDRRAGYKHVVLPLNILACIS